MTRQSFISRLTTIAAAVAGLAIATTTTNAQVTLYDNGVPPAMTGGLSTGATAENGTAAPAPSTWSELQHDTGNTTESNTILGYSENQDASGTANPTGGLRVADDFTVPPNQLWQIERFWVYSYTTNGGVTYDAAHFQVWNGQPGVLGATVVFGDLTTNRHVASAAVNILRTGGTVVPAAAAPTTLRSVFRIEMSALTGVTTGTTLNLPPGHYWLEWQTSNSTNTNHFTPPATAIGMRLIAGSNARQFAGSAPGAWAPLIDTGNPAAAPDLPSDLAFQIRGTMGNGCLVPLKPCPADNAPAPNGNGLVNVDDLLGVINSWGGVMNQPPRPQGDNAPLPNGNCLVNVDDLLGVINAWGSCPPPTGGCCLPNGTCMRNQTQAACTGAGGNYLGNFVSCTGITCPIPPPNDLCANAQTVGNGSFPWTNMDANNDGTATPNNACDVNITHDVWFNYQATCSGAVTIDTIGSTGATDTIIAVYNGWACPQGNFIGCNDDISPTAPINTLSSVTVPVTTGQQIKIRVGSFGASQNGAGILNIACVGNDPCQGALPIAVGGTASGTVASAGSDASFPQCAGISATNGKWYTVVGNGNSLTASTCGTTPAPFWDGRISVYCGTSCSDLTCVNAADANSCANFQESVTWCSALGRTYYILVHTNSGPVAPDGAFVLSVTNGAMCTGAVACGCFSCPLGSEPEGEPCLTTGNDTINGGCNVTPAVFGSITVNGPAKCGTCSTYINGPNNQRDIDWYQFTTAGGTFRIELNARFPALAGFIQTVPCSATFVAGSTATTTGNCQQLFTPAVTLAAGTYSAIITVNGFLGFPCAAPGTGNNEYWMRVVSP